MKGSSSFPNTFSTLSETWEQDNPQAVEDGQGRVLFGLEKLDNQGGRVALQNKSICFH